MSPVLFDAGVEGEPEEIPSATFDALTSNFSILCPSFIAFSLALLFEDVSFVSPPYPPPDRRAFFGDGGHCLASETAVPKRANNSRIPMKEKKFCPIIAFVSCY